MYWRTSFAIMTVEVANPKASVQRIAIPRCLMILLAVSPIIIMAAPAAIMDGDR